MGGYFGVTSDLNNRRLLIDHNFFPRETAMKYFIFDADKFDQQAFLKELGQDSADVKLKNPDGTHTRMSFTPSGVSMTVEQLTDLCNKSPNKEFAAMKLTSVKGLSPATEVVIDVVQVEQLRTAPEKASDVGEAKDPSSGGDTPSESKEIPYSTSETTGRSVKSSNDPPQVTRMSETGECGVTEDGQKPVSQKTHDRRKP